MNLEVDKPIQLTVFAVLIIGGLAFSLTNIETQRQVDPVDTNITQNQPTQASNNISNNSSDSAEEQVNVTEIIQNKSQKYTRARPLVSPDGYINTENVSIEENIGEKVILLDMWTYSCINCQRTLPHIQEWHRKYEDDGLLIIGNHAPEFDFERDRGNVEDAVERFNITYPVVQDNDYGTWDAYNNRYWPQKYLIGVDGFIRYEHIGEGSYNQTEEKIRELLKEKNERLGIDKPIDSDGVKELDENRTTTGDVNSSKIETPEIYFGADRNYDLANGEYGETGVMNLEAPEPGNFTPNELYLDGEWNITEYFAKGTEGDSIQINYTAKNVNMVLDGDNTEVSIYHNGEPIRNDIAGDSVENSRVTVDSEQLYKIVQKDGYSSGILRVEVEEGTLDAYTFTFG